MQNTHFLFRDGASICQVNQQQALRDRKGCGGGGGIVENGAILSY